MIKKFLAGFFRNGMGAANSRKVEVVFSLRLAERRNQVVIAGSFNRWSCLSHPLRPAPSGNWEIRLRLAPGEYRYRFLIDNTTWALDPLASAVLNEYGGSDSLRVVALPASERTPAVRLEGQFA